MTSYGAASYFNNFGKPRAAVRAKSSAIAKGRYQNKPVKSIYKKRVKKTKTNMNKSAITMLSKQVRTLQLQRYGFKQYQRQYAILDSAVATTMPLSTTPLLFLANSFYDSNPIYQGTVSATGVPSYAAGPVPLIKQTFDTDLADQYQWNEQNNQQTVSSVQYLPVYTKMKFTLTGMLKGGSSMPHPIRYRFTLFRLKKQVLSSAVLDMSLPNTAGAYWHMCEDNPSIRNHFLKHKHEVVVDRYVTIRPPPHDTELENVYRTVEIPYSFGKCKPIQPVKEPQPPNQNTYNKIPEEQCLWLLISSNQTANNGININIEKLNIYRDQHGVSIL